jgi:hypothetical protein
MAGRVCPACRRNVDAAPEPEPKPDEIVEADYTRAAEQLRQGVARSEIEAALTERGLSAEKAATVANDLEQRTASAAKIAGRKNMLYGSLWCAGGVAATAATYRAAGDGGTFVIAWGAMLFGGIQFIRGLLQTMEK